MAGRIPRSFIDDILSRVDVVEVVNSRVKLKKAGKNYMACCPFHQEKTPSFTVSPDKQFYYCFGCGASGNAIGFLMDYDRMGFVEAVESLAGQLGLEVPREGSDQEAPRYQYAPLLELLEQATTFYEQQLKHSSYRQQAVDYLKQRGLTGQIAKQFRLGFAPPGWDSLTSQFDQQPGLLVEAGLAISKNNRCYDRFRHRIMFPIRNIKGQVVAFGGRVLGDEKPKYLNSPETPVFHKGEELYGLYEARQHNALKERALIVEGYMDVIALAQHGIHYAMATLGTATSDTHLRRLFRYTPEIVFCFDGDEAGRRAARRALEVALPHMQDGRQIRFLFLPEGEDPDTLVRKQGPELFEDDIRKALPLSEFLLAMLMKQTDLTSLDGRAKLASLATPWVQQMQPGLFRTLFIEQLAEIVKIQADTLSRQLLPETVTPAAPVQATPAATAPAAPAPAEPAPSAEDPPADYAFLPEERAEQFERAGNIPFIEELQKQTRGSSKLVDTLILALLHRPQLAATLELPDHYRQLDEANIDLLFDIHQLFRETPDASWATLLGQWHGTEAGQHLARLLALEILIPHDNLAAECQDALATLDNLWLEQEIARALQQNDMPRYRELYRLRAARKGASSEADPDKPQNS